MQIPQTPYERAQYLMDDEKFEKTHEAMAQEG